MMQSPKKPSLRRYFQICQTRHSLLRFHEYEVLGGMLLSGSVLDIGGVKNSKKCYKSLFNGFEQWDYLNVDVQCRPDVVASVEFGLPLKDGAYNNVVCMNTLEHVYNIQSATREMVRVTKPGGKMVISMPYIFQQHGDPDDYHRPTASWWVRFLGECGVQESDVSITPLCWDLLSTGLSLLDNTFHSMRKFFRPLILAPGLLRSALVHTSVGSPLGYIIIVQL